MYSDILFSDFYQFFDYVEQVMTDIVIVVDAQNGFCHPEGIIGKQWVKTESRKRELTETVARIKAFLKTARTRGIPIVYLCSNEKQLSTDLDWHVQIHEDLAPQKQDDVFWRDAPGESRPLEKTNDFLKKFPDPHLLLCGFYSDMCVANFAFKALKSGLPASFVINCVFPYFNKQKQKRFLGIHERLSYGFDDRLVRFLPMSAVFPNANPPVPK